MGQYSQLAVGSTNIARVDGLQDQNGNYQNDANVTLENLTTTRGVAVANVTFPLTLVYVQGSNGRYEVALPLAADIVENKTYVATFKAIGSQQYQAQWTERVVGAAGVA
ncbi:MAG: hypothetical protein AAFX44_06605 [Pseudomonadota bacterium]